MGEETPDGLEVLALRNVLGKRYKMQKQKSASGHSELHAPPVAPETWNPKQNEGQRSGKNSGAHADSTNAALEPVSEKLDPPDAPRALFSQEKTA